MVGPLLGHPWDWEGASARKEEARHPVKVWGLGFRFAMATRWHGRSARKCQGEVGSAERRRGDRTAGEAERRTPPTALITGIHPHPSPGAGMGHQSPRKTPPHPKHPQPGNPGMEEPRGCHGLGIPAPGSSQAAPGMGLQRPSSFHPIPPGRGSAGGSGLGMLAWLSQGCSAALQLSWTG
ncbi:translation initiation factor IF-2-like isoform X3 [Pipra filicauda]|nr:translation initiation factor IF-2-like isoform X3 [Pipra filicauda]